MSGNTRVLSGIRGCRTRSATKTTIWRLAQRSLFAAFGGAPGATMRGTPAARTGTGSLSGTTSPVFVSPGLSNNLPSIPLALFPLRFAFPFAILRLLRFPATDAPATRAAWRASLKFEMSPFAPAKGPLPNQQQRHVSPRATLLSHTKTELLFIFRSQLFNFFKKLTVSATHCPGLALYTAGRHQSCVIAVRPRKPFTGAHTHAARYCRRCRKTCGRQDQ